MRTFIITFLVAILIYSGSFADSLFTVDGIKVSNSGASAKQAKESATLTGKREAFDILLQRVASDPTNASLTGIDSAKLNELVQGVEVNDEKVTASYYSATLSISFNKSMVEKLLQESNVSFVEKKGEAIVLVPLLISGGQNMLFEEANPLRKSLADFAVSSRVLNIIVPVNLRGVDKNKLNVNIEELPQDVKDSLLKLGQNYRASKLILIAASQSDKETLDIRLRDIQDPSGAIKEMSFKAKDAGSGEGLFAYAARGIGSVLESQWVKGKTGNNVALSQLTLTVPFSSIDEWLVIRKKLETISYIKSMNVKTLTVQYALVDIAFSEEFESFNSKMRESGLFLDSTGDNIILHVKTVNHSTNDKKDNTKFSHLNRIKNDQKG